MKNILIFSTAYYPFVGGAEVSIKEITERLSDFEFDMITARMSMANPKIERIGRVKVYRVGFGFRQIDKFLLPLFGLFKALQLDKKKNYKTIWSMMASQGGVGASLFKTFRKNKKLVLTLEEGDEEEHLKRYVLGNELLYKILIRPWHLLPFKKANTITAISNYLAQRALKNNVTAKIKIIPIGVNISKFENIPSDFNKVNFKKKLGIEGDEKIIITTSRLVKKNAVDDLIKGFAIFIKNYPECRTKLLIMGGGEKENELKALAEKLSVSNSIIFYGSYELDDLPPHLWVSDVFCRPSLSEGLGISFLEAIASGVIVLATKVGGIPDFLEDGVTGFFCEKEEPDSIANNFTKILINSNQNALQNIKSQALAKVKKNYSWDKISDQMKGVF